jgi:uncharacterized delta-60 repeat protein
MTQPTSTEALESRVLLSIAVLDPTFGVDGVAATDFSPQTDVYEDVTVQPDGKVVAVGGNGQDFIVARYNPDGTPDASFGDGGRATTDFPRNPLFPAGPHGPDRALAAVMQPDEKILAVGYHDDGEVPGLEDWALARYLPSGALDPDFGDGGLFLFQPTPAAATAHYEERAFDVVVAPDGKILVAGNTFHPYENKGVVARFNPDGTIDAGYGTGGLAGGVPIRKFSALALQADGSVLAAGPGTTSVELAWFSPSGRLNPAFGNFGGWSLLGIRTSPTVEQLVEYPDGRSLVVGSDYSGNDPSGGNFLLARFAANGRPDLTFGPDRYGYVVSNLATYGNAARAASVLPDGRILAAGQSRYAAGFARYTANGVLDTAFGTGGMTRLDPYRYASDQVNAAQFLPDGKVLMGGGLGSAGRPAFVARVLPEAPVPVITGRHVFYNDSAFDGHDPAANGDDLRAIAPDKVALLPGQPATFASVTSYTRGINGVIIEFDGILPGPLTTGDVTFLAAPADTRTAFRTAPVPTAVRRVSGAEETVTRYAVTWPDGALRNAWLRVKVYASEWSGLARDDAFYFGNLVGKFNGGPTGGSPASLRVDAFDVTATRRALFSAAPIEARGDYDRDGRVTPADLAAARGNLGHWIEMMSSASPAARPAAAANPSPAPATAALREDERVLFRPRLPSSY